MSDFLDQFWHDTMHRPYKLSVKQHSQQGPVVIMLHGIAASSDKWSELVALLKPSYRCYTIDLLGFGTSPKPQWASYTMEDHVRAIHKTIASLRLGDDIILIGHSLGSLLATRYARLYPRHVSRLVLLSAPVYPPLDQINNRLARKRTELFLKLYKFLRSDPRITPQSFKQLSRLLPLPKSVISHPETWLPFMRSLEHCIEQQTLLADIRDIAAPIDMFYGTLDQVAIPHNIQQVHKIKAVTTHKVITNHDINKRYAKAVAKLLIVPVRKRRIKNN